MVQMSAKWKYILKKVMMVKFKCPTLLCILFFRAVSCWPWQSGGVESCSCTIQCMFTTVVVMHRKTNRATVRNLKCVYIQYNSRRNDILHYIMFHYSLILLNTHVPTYLGTFISIKIKQNPTTSHFSFRFK